MEFQHCPILLDSCIELLNVTPSGIYVDCTVGGGGHSSEILARLNSSGRLIAFDKDMEAIEHVKQRFSSYNNVEYLHSDYKQAANILKAEGVTQVDGILMDLGVSSYQLDNKERGFSYMGDNKLDMRMDMSQELSAYEVVNGYSEQRLFEVIRDFGEDNFAKNIAKHIAIERAKSPITTTKQLAEIVDGAIPYAVKKNGGHPAKRTFQAIRIEVNGELEGLSQAVTQLAKLLRKGGRMAVLTFHSLEDRIVKNAFRDLATGCICPKSAPICVCHHEAQVKLMNNKPIIPTQDEIDKNSRAASAKLRAIERL